MNIDHLIKEHLNELGEEEKKLVREAVEKVSVSEKDLMNRLHVEEEKLSGFLKAVGKEKAKEKEASVFEENVSDSELASVSGGDDCGSLSVFNCSHSSSRSIYPNPNGIYPITFPFPNCACTVEDGSWCDSNDACYMFAVVYTGMKSCSKAWR